MSKQTGAKFGALAFMLVGIGIGYFAAKGGFESASPALARIGAGTPENDQDDRNSKTGLVQADDPPSPNLQKPRTTGLSTGT